MSYLPGCNDFYLKKPTLIHNNVFKYIELPWLTAKLIVPTFIFKTKKNTSGFLKSYNLISDCKIWLSDSGAGIQKLKLGMTPVLRE